MRKTLTVLLIAVAVLVGFGIVVLATAGVTRAESLYGQPNYFLKRQMIFLVMAFAAGLVAARFDYHWYKNKWLMVGMVGGVVALLLALWIPGVGCVVNGSRRWIRFPGFNIQPSEFAKIVSVLAVSVWLDHIGWRVRQFRQGAVMPAVILALFLVPIVLQPDFGCAMVLIVLVGGLMVIARVPIPYFMAGALVALLGVGLMVANNPNRMARIRAFGEGSETTSSAGHHLKQSIIAFKSGGPLGVGLGNSMQKHAYLPEAHTDFIFAIAGEEMGLPATLGVVILFGTVLVCGLLITVNAPDRLGRFVAFGATLLLVFQAMFNMGVVTGCLPTKGLALPFISYGGSSMLADFIAVGLLVNVGLHIDQADDHLHTCFVRDAVQRV